MYTWQQLGEVRLQNLVHRIAKGASSLKCVVSGLTGLLLDGISACRAAIDVVGTELALTHVNSSTHGVPFVKNEKAPNVRVRACLLRAETLPTKPDPLRFRNLG